MHMADALLSPAVGIALWAASGVTLAWCARKVGASDRDDLVPLMGVLGAFVFAAQMITFAIPGTGSSGHIGGALLLSILLGPPAALVVMASVLTVQALFFADGGLLALGANIFNLGVVPCFVGYALIYRPLLRRAGAAPSARRVGAITLLAAVIGLQFGALGVVLQTRLSGISSLPLDTFVLLMQPIHLAIGLIEGLATAALILFVRQARPDLLLDQAVAHKADGSQARMPARLLAPLAVIALLGGVLFASSQPDGLEWAVRKITGRTELAQPDSALHARLAQWQEKLTVLPDYQFAGAAKDKAAGAARSLSGLVGGGATLALVVLLAYLFKRRSRRAADQPPSQSH